jgi:hypothetical protein
MLHLPNITLVAIDAVTNGLCRLALADTLRVITPAKILLYSDQPEDWQSDWPGHWFRANPRSLAEVTKILWGEIPFRVSTSHYLTIQWDGWAVNPSAWTDEFLNYDYIGAPWLWEPTFRVGNGGFSLRSTKLGRFVVEHNLQCPESEPEDVVLCQVYRPLLESNGLRWAPVELAQQFSFEGGEPASGGSFGFHDCGNWPRILNREKLNQRLARANAYVKSKPGWAAMLENSPCAERDEVQLLRRADELLTTLQAAQAELSKSWYGRQILQRGRASLKKESFRSNLIGDAKLSNALTGLEIAAASHVEANAFDAALRLIHAKAGELWFRTQASGWISGSHRLDRLCLSIGREVRGVTDRRIPAALTGRHRHVYVVSELYREGGHTRLLEDLIAAQPHDDHQIIWTDGESAAVIANIADVLRVEKTIPLHILRGETVERLRDAFAILAELCPDVLVHLGHPNDPIAIALMQPGIARQRLMIHHADCSFALGRSLEGTVHIALGRHFQDFARREWALETVLLPLTCGEPVVAKAADGARDRPFFTVTSGSSGKFDLNGQLSYLDVLTERFAARDGVHVHIGSLAAEQMLRIEQHLDKLCCRKRFVYIEHVPHLASKLSELAPSAYIDSFPVGGGKAIIEAMAAGVPICAANHDPNLDSSSFCYPECFWWTHPAQVGTILAGLDPMTIERHVALSRSYFERNHSPKIFKRRLLALIN